MDLRKRILGLVSEKDLNSVIIYCNDVFSEYTHCKNNDDIIGRSDKDFPWENRAHLYRAHELDAISGKIYSAIIPLCGKDGDLLFMHNKVPIIGESGKTTGLYCNATEILNLDLKNLYIHLMKKNPPKDSTFYTGKKLNSRLTKREEEVLFFIGRGKTAKLIGEILGLSERTITSYIESIKEKLNCHKKSELIDVAYEMYRVLLPQDLSPKLILDGLSCN